MLDFERSSQLAQTHSNLNFKIERVNMRNMIQGKVLASTISSWAVDCIAPLIMLHHLSMKEDEIFSSDDEKE